MTCVQLACPAKPRQTSPDRERDERIAAVIAQAPPPSPELVARIAAHMGWVAAPAPLKASA